MMDTRTSEAIDALAAAMALAQSILTNPTKSKKAEIATRSGTKFAYEYADLAHGLDAIRKAFSAQHVAFVQIPLMEKDWIMLRTRAIHKSGQWIEGEMPVAKMGTNPQDIGSAMTYAKKQSIFAMAGICGSDDDDDGAAASKRNGATEQLDASAATYISLETTQFETIQTTKELKSRWNDQANTRQQLGLVNGAPGYPELFAKYAERGKALTSAEKPAQ